MRNLSNIRRKVEKLERARGVFDHAPDIDPYSAIRARALARLSDEELEILLALLRQREGRELNPSVEVSAAQEAALGALNDAVQKECQRSGIAVAQFNEQHGLAKPLVMSTKQRQIERNRSRRRRNPYS